MVGIGVRSRREAEFTALTGRPTYVPVSFYAYDLVVEWVLRAHARRSVRNLCAVIGALIVPLLTGCAQASVPVQGSPSASTRPNDEWRPKEPVPRETVSEAEAKTLRDGYLAQIAKDLSVDPSTAPPLVRWVYPDQRGAVFTECMGERGFTVTPSSGGAGIRAQVPPSQQSAYNQALFECEAKYTVDARALRPPSPALLSVAYDYTVEWLIPCLAKNGYPNVEPPSSRATYIASGGDWDGYPFSDEKMGELCPVQPPNSVVFGE